jgi:hypothetical protein
MIMKLRMYSSVAAFLAHLHALTTASSRTPDEDRVFAAMTEMFAVLSSPERDALSGDANDPATRRHRERAELKLQRELIARGTLAG